MISLRSKVARKLLSYFYLHGNEQIYLNELVRKLKEDKRNLVKKLHEFEAEGLLRSEMLGPLKMYSLNKKYSLYKEYEKIVLKTFGLEKKINEVLANVDGVSEAYIFGSYAQGKMDVYSDIDLLVIGGHNSLSLRKKLRPVQQEIDREINVVDMDLKEYKKRLKAQDPFLKNVFSGKNIKVIS